MTIGASWKNKNCEIKMDPASLVLIDTGIWSSYVARKDSTHKAAVESLLEEDRAALIGPIVAEILLGYRRTPEADWVASTLEGLRYLDVRWEDWRDAARLGRELAARG